MDFECPLQCPYIGKRDLSRCGAAWDCGRVEDYFDPYNHISIKRLFYGQLFSNVHTPFQLPTMWL